MQTNETHEYENVYAIQMKSLKKKQLFGTILLLLLQPICEFGDSLSHFAPIFMDTRLQLWGPIFSFCALFSVVMHMSISVCSHASTAFNTKYTIQLCVYTRILQTTSLCLVQRLGTKLNSPKIYRSKKAYFPAQ